MKPSIDSSTISINLKSTSEYDVGGGGSAGSGRRKWEGSRKGELLYRRECLIHASLVGK